MIHESGNAARSAMAHPQEPIMFIYAILRTAAPDECLGYGIARDPRTTTLKPGYSRHLVKVLAADGYRKKGDIQIVDTRD